MKNMKRIHETQDLPNIHATKRTFSSLAIGDTFDFIDMSQPMMNSFYSRCVKISTRKYQAIEEPKTEYRVGSISARVYHVSEVASIPKAVLCPQCNEPIWDVAFASKLNKCWNCGLAFDSDEEDSSEVSNG